MTGPEAGVAWLRRQVPLVLLVLLTPLVPALAALDGRPTTTVLAAAALALLTAAATLLVTMRPAVAAGPGQARLRAWGRVQSGIERAQAPDRPGRPRPRAPGGGGAAPER